MSNFKTPEKWFDEWRPLTEDGQVRKAWWSESYNDNPIRRFFWTKDDIVDFAQAYSDYRIKAEREQKPCSHCGGETEIETSRYCKDVNCIGHQRGV